jgi:signal transduction histidine kinase
MPVDRLANRKPRKTQPQTAEYSEVLYDETRLLELTRRLTERVKELNCLYGMSRLFEDEKLSTEDILRGLIGVMPPAWQYPEITCVRIKTKNKEYTTANFQETPWRQAQNITVNGKIFGVVEVYYLEERPALDEGPFLKEERNLIYIISERLGHMIERQMAESNVKFLYHREKGLRQQLQSEMRVRVDFTRKLIHELKTPLTALIATSQLLYDETEGEKLGKLAKYIWDGASNLNNRIDELHDVIRGETGILKINPQKINLGTLLHSLVEETQALCQQSGMKIDLFVEKELPEVYADPDRIRQVVLNLINNAVKYAREGQSIRIEAVGKPDTIRPDAVQVEVKDYGPGISKERQSTIFKPGYQQKQAEERAGGLGIGLALCKIIIDHHGGRIWVKSQPDKGTSFFFTIPIK